MEYRRLGRAGIKVSELSFGSWLTFGSNLDLDQAKQCFQEAFSNGINFFDCAEVYGNGAAELIMGEALRSFPREHIVVSTKLFWGGHSPNEQGLSYKHLFEGIHNSLRRLQMEYVDLIFCHRPDPDTPIEETVRGMDQIIRSGKALYWGTSEWSAEEITEAHIVAREIGAIPPTMEQPQYNLLRRKRLEIEYAPLYAKFGMGTTTWSPLAGGILSGKYNHSIPENSRYGKVESLKKYLTNESIEKARELELLANDLNCSSTQLALAWCLKKPHVSSVITGASNVDQLRENLTSIEVKNKLNEQMLKKIEKVTQVDVGGEHG